jgi:hypothetical protein
MGYSHSRLQSSMGVHDATDGVGKGFEVFFCHDILLRFAQICSEGEGDNGDRTGQKEEEVKGFI